MKTNQHSKQGGQQHKCKVPQCPYRHDHPQQQESLVIEYESQKLFNYIEKYFSGSIGKLRALIVNYTEAREQKAISTERQRVLCEVRELVEKLATDWDGSGNTEVQLALHDVLSALKEMEAK